MSELLKSQTEFLENFNSFTRVFQQLHSFVGCFFLTTKNKLNITFDKIYKKIYLRFRGYENGSEFSTDSFSLSFIRLKI